MSGRGPNTRLGGRRSGTGPLAAGPQPATNPDLVSAYMVDMSTSQADLPCPAVLDGLGGSEQRRKDRPRLGLFGRPGDR